MISKKRMKIATENGVMVPIGDISLKQALALMDGCWEKPYRDVLDGYRLVDESTGKVYRVKVKYELEEVGVSIRH